MKTLCQHSSHTAAFVCLQPRQLFEGLGLLHLARRQVCYCRPTIEELEMLESWCINGILQPVYACRDLLIAVERLFEILLEDMTQCAFDCLKLH